MDIPSDVAPTLWVLQILTEEGWAVVDSMTNESWGIDIIDAVPERVSGRFRMVRYDFAGIDTHG